MIDLRFCLKCRTDLERLSLLCILGRNPAETELRKIAARLPKDRDRRPE